MGADPVLVLVRESGRDGDGLEPVDSVGNVLEFRKRCLIDSLHGNVQRPTTGEANRKGGIVRNSVPLKTGVPEVPVDKPLIRPRRRARHRLRLREGLPWLLGDPGAGPGTWSAAG